MDGKSDTTFSSGSCSQTGLATNPWWRVDLGRAEPVNQVYIVNRGDSCCGDWLDSFEIRVGKSRFRLILFNQFFFTNLLTFYLICQATQKLILRQIEKGAYHGQIKLHHKSS